MKCALARKQEGEAHAIPLVVRGVNWKLIRPPAGLGAVPGNGRAVTKWSGKDSARRDVSGQIRKVFESMRDADCAAPPRAWNPLTRRGAVC